MSTTDVGTLRTTADRSARELAASHLGVAASIRTVLTPLASLQLTVVLFAISIVLVLAGTVAQRHHDIWHVVNEYFRAWIAWIELQAFFPASAGISSSWVVPFPGGWLIGALLSLNLVAAHAMRFKVAAKGGRLIGGLALLAGGAACTYAVVLSGLDDTVESELSPEFCSTLWHGLRAALGGIALSAAYALAILYPKARDGSHRWLWGLGVSAAILLASLTVYLFQNPNARLDPSGLRILWQLIKATGASLILWSGCNLVFAKRAGIVLLHLGVALMMFSELFTAQYAVEANMQIFEGQTVSHAQDTRFIELAIVDKSSDEKDVAVTVPGWMIVAAAESRDAIGHEALPFRIKVADFLPNADVRLAHTGEKPSATRGQGQLRMATAVSSSTGVDREQTVDIPAAIIELLDQESDQSLGTLLVSPMLSTMFGPDAVATDDGLFEFELRFKRIEKPYSVTVHEVKKDDYVGSDTPKNYESVVTVRDKQREVDQTFRIWMNNPLRYGGDTLYQSGYDESNGRRRTGLQVVSNSGWMIPYVACMIVATGMLVQFGSSLWRFVRRREEEHRRRLAELSNATASGYDKRLLANWRRPSVWVPAIVVLLFAGYMVSRAVPPRESAAEMHVREFGQLPVAFAGRSQPMDSLARNTLRLISGQQSFKDADGGRQPAIRWMLDLVAGAGGWRNHQVIRITNLEVLQLLNLQRRKGFHYSFAEVVGDQEQSAELQRQFADAQEANAQGEPLSLIQKKLIELDLKLRRVVSLAKAFETPPIEHASSPEDLRHIQQQVARLNQSFAVPRPAPPTNPEATWKTVYEAALDALRNSVNDPTLRERHESTVELIQLLGAYRDGAVQEFNSLVVDYGNTIERIAAAETDFEAELSAAGERGGRKPAERLLPERLAFEAYFNHVDPFLLCKIFYIVAFVFAAAAFLGWSEGFNRSANWLLWATFALHSFALLCRIYISGRPPVTNLYSSAVFIGWGAVLFALVFEMTSRMGVGNLLGAAIGFPTMMIAKGLMTDGSGDTFGVMQAVLDTNFWLATHVVCISLGYVTTFLAGAFGLGYILLGRMFGLLNGDQRKQLSKMTYGAVCFAMFFSFVGTVLGGLWADDSWGRFWGWDPKENGALMIVLWNALVLHARWGRMVADRGLAVLVVFGNVVTAWSWFGVNQLGIGLHSYGFSEGLTRGLVLFAISQVVVMGIATMPERAPTGTSTAG